MPRGLVGRRPRWIEQESREFFTGLQASWEQHDALRDRPDGPYLCVCRASLVDDLAQPVAITAEKSATRAPTEKNVFGDRRVEMKDQIDERRGLVPVAADERRSRAPHQRDLVARVEYQHLLARLIRGRQRNAPEVTPVEQRPAEQ